MKEIIKYCECGCGKIVKSNRRFISGHNAKFNTGNKNGQYIDGRCSKKYHCIEPNCNKEITRSTYFRGTKKCYEHSEKGPDSHKKDCQCLFVKIEKKNLINLIVNVLLVKLKEENM